METTESTILDLIYGLKRQCTLNDESFFKKNDISQAEYNMFLCLKNCKHFNSYSVADKMQLSLSRISRIIDKMVSKEYLKRTTNKIDRRAIDIKITAKGKKTLENIIIYRNNTEDLLLQKLSATEAQEIKSNLQKLTNLL